MFPKYFEACFHIVISLQAHFGSLKAYCVAQSASKERTKNFHHESRLQSLVLDTCLQNNFLNVTIKLFFSSLCDEMGLATGGKAF